MEQLDTVFALAVRNDVVIGPNPGDKVPLGHRSGGRISHQDHQATIGSVEHFGAVSGQSGGQRSDLCPTLALVVADRVERGESLVPKQHQELLAIGGTDHGRLPPTRLCLQDGAFRRPGELAVERFGLPDVWIRVRAILGKGSTSIAPQVECDFEDRVKGLMHWHGDAVDTMELMYDKAYDHNDPHRAAAWECAYTLRARHATLGD